MSAKIENLLTNNKISKTVKYIFIIFLTFMIVYFVFMYANRSESADYLIEKYDFKNSKIVLLNYTPKFKLKTAMQNLLGVNYQPAKWTFYYEGRKFEVIEKSVVVNEKDNNIYFDNYQLEDISKWSTEYLKKEVDLRIEGVELTRLFLNEKISEDGIGEFLSTQDNCIVKIFYRANSIFDFVDRGVVSDDYYDLKHKILNVIDNTEYDYLYTVCVVDRGLKFSREKTSIFGFYSYKSDLSYMERKSLLCR